VDAGYQALRNRVSNALSPALTDPNQYLYTLHTAQVSVSYTPDVFGGVGAKALGAGGGAGAMWRTRARVSVVANLVQAVVQNASLDQQIAAAREAITANREILTLVPPPGAGRGGADVAAQQTALAAAETALPPLERAQKHQQALIAVFTGVAPGTRCPRCPL
jgi:outer membrane protein TolC